MTLYKDMLKYSFIMFILCLSYGCSHSAGNAPASTHANGERFGPSTLESDPPPGSGMMLSEAINDAKTICVVTVKTIGESELAGPGCWYYGNVVVFVDRALRGDAKHGDMISCRIVVEVIPSLRAERLVADQQYIMFGKLVSDNRCEVIKMADDR